MPKNMKKFIVFGLFAMTIILPSCAGEVKPEEPEVTQGIDGFTLRGVYQIDWSAGFAKNTVFHVNVYAQNLIDWNKHDHHYWKNWRSAGWMESDNQLMNDVISKENLHIGFAPEEGGWTPAFVSGKAYNEVYGYLKTSFIQGFKPYIPDADGHHGYAFSFCETEGGINIVADKPLFGIPAGSDLSERFIITSADPQFRVKYPSFEVIDKEQSCLGLSAKEFFVKNMAVCQMRQNNGLYEIAFSEIPPEDYSEITFTISIPVSIYDDCYEQLCAGRQLSDIKGKARVMKGTTTVYFGKTAQENWHLNKVERMKGSFNREAIEYW